MTMRFNHSIISSTFEKNCAEKKISEFADTNLNSFVSGKLLSAI